MVCYSALACFAVFSGLAPARGALQSGRPVPLRSLTNGLMAGASSPLAGRPEKHLRLKFTTRIRGFQGPRGVHDCRVSVQFMVWPLMFQFSNTGMVVARLLRAGASIRLKPP